jgi:hypothetical protein
VSVSVPSTSIIAAMVSMMASTSSGLRTRPADVLGDVPFAL